MARALVKRKIIKGTCRILYPICKIRQVPFLISEPELPFELSALCPGTIVKKETANTPHSPVEKGSVAIS